MAVITRSQRSVLSVLAALLVLSSAYPTDALSRVGSVRRAPTLHPQTYRQLSALEAQRLREFMQKYDPSSQTTGSTSESIREALNLPSTMKQRILEPPPAVLESMREPIRRLHLRDQASLSAEERAAAERQRVKIVWSDTETGKLLLGSTLSEREAVVEREQHTSQRSLEDRDNSEALQNRKVRKLLQGVGASDTLYLTRSDPINSGLVMRYLPREAFVTRMVSDEATLARNMERLATRDFSSRVRVFDYAPKSEQALREMGLPETSMRQWQGASERIEKSATSDQLAGKNEPVERFFETLREAGEGTVVLLFGHSDGKSFWIDTGTRRYRITAARLRAELARTPQLPVMVALNCETEATLAPAFLEAGSPLVFTSRDPLPVKQARKFVERYLRYVNEEGVDAIDAVFDAQRDVNLPGFGPISVRPLERSPWLG